MKRNVNINTSVFSVNDETHIAQRTVTVVNFNDDSTDEDSTDDVSDVSTDGFSTYDWTDHYENDRLDRRSHGRIAKLLHSYGFIKAMKCCRKELTAQFIFFHKSGLFVSTFGSLFRKTIQYLSHRCLGQLIT